MYFSPINIKYTDILFKTDSRDRLETNFESFTKQSETILSNPILLLKDSYSLVYIVYIKY